MQTLFRMLMYFSVACSCFNVSESFRPTYIFASVMLLSYICRQEQADKLERALDICMYEEKKLVCTGREDGCTGEQFSDYVMETIAKL